MPANTHRLLTVLICSALISASIALADDKDKPALSGTWLLKGAEMKIEFDKDVMKISPHGKDEMILIVCKFTAGKDGLVKAKITEFEGQDEFKDKIKEKLPIGTEFRFKWQAKDNTAKLDDVKGDKFEAFKSHLEGDYDKK